MIKKITSLCLALGLLFSVGLPSYAKTENSVNQKAAQQKVVKIEKKTSKQVKAKKRIWNKKSKKRNKSKKFFKRTGDKERKGKNKSEGKEKK